MSSKGKGTPPQVKKSNPDAQGLYYYIIGDKLKSRMIYDYSDPTMNIIFNREFIEKNTELNLDWEGPMGNIKTDDGKIGPWFKNNDKAISDKDANKILKIV